MRTSKNRRVCFWLGLLMPTLAGTAALADTIQLKNGQSIEGRYIDTKDNVVIVEGKEGTIRIAAEDVIGLRIDYTGVRVCIRRAQDGRKEQCGLFLHEVRENTAVLVNPDKSLRRVPLSEIATLRPEGPSTGIASALQPGAEVEFRTRSGRFVRGRVVSSGADQIVLTDELGSRIVVPSAEVGSLGVGVTAAHGNRVARTATGRRRRTGLDMRALVPGWAQIARGDTAQGFLFGMAVFASAGALAFEYQRARQAGAAAARDPFYLAYANPNTAIAFLYLWQTQNSLTTPMLLLFSPRDYTVSFERHQRGQRAAGAALGLFYLWSALDGFLRSNPQRAATHAGEPRARRFRVSFDSTSDSRYEVAIHYAF